MQTATHLVAGLGLTLAFAPLAPSQTAGAADTWPSFVTWAQTEFGEPGARAAAFLAENRPERDAGIDRQILEDNLRYALRARAEFPWASALDEATFLNDVLPYAVFDETRENWRPEMFARVRSIVEDCSSATEAAQALNREVFQLVNVHYNTDRERPNQSPAESIRQGKASCTGLSVLLVDACRAAGVPARAAGVASWNGKRGNHTWVEIFDDGRWWYTGADEYDAKGLDRGWFTGDARRAVAGHPTKAVRATSFRRTGEAFPMVWARADRSVPGVDVTARYTGSEEAGAELPATGTAVCFVRSWNGDERQVASVRVIDPETGEVVGSVETRAGRADLNDMPDVKLKPGKTYRFEVLRDGVTRLLWHEAQEGKRTLDLRDESLSLTAEAARELLAKKYEAALSAKREAAEKALEEKVIRAAGQDLRLLERTFGDAPEGSRSLWISMHGGGGAPARTNDGQWRNQIRLYEPAEGIVVAPRAPTNTWNLWHQGHIDPLFDELIASYVAARGVDPERVYLMGYSAGGDGVYQLAPRMADRFAAASMMAGHPNETQPDGLRNLPFMIFMGGKDAAYDRNEIAAAWGEKLATLQKADPAGYPHKVTIYPEFGHWMNRRDAEALPWMAERTRTPWPKKIVWLQDDVTHPRFYWLELQTEQVRARQRIVAAVDGQTVEITTTDEKLSALTLRLSDELLDLDQPLTVRVNGEQVFEGRAPRTESAVETSLAQRLDVGTAATARLELSW